MLISEASDQSDAVALGMAVLASGSFSNKETVRAWATAEFKGIQIRQQVDRQLHSTRQLTSNYVMLRNLSAL